MDPRVLLAIDRIIKDVDKNYDECLVDKFLESIGKELIGDHISGEKWIPAAQVIVNRVKSFTDHESFVMLNQSRAFKVLNCVLKTKKLCDDEFVQIQPALDSFWNTLDVIIVNDNASAMAIMLSVFRHIMLSKPGFKWLIEKKIEQPFKLIRGQEIKDITSLARFYIETGKNYHTRKQAELLFEALILSAKNLPQNHPQFVALAQTMQDFLLANSTSITHILVDLLGDGDGRLAFDRYETSKMLQASFNKLIEQPGARINNLCKCLAMSNSSKDFDVTLERLKSKNNLEGIIVYLANSRHKVSEQLLITYLLYPLLATTNCSSDDDSQLLIQKLLATREERDFIDRNTNSKIITLSLIHLNQIISKEILYTIDRGSVFSSRGFNLLAHVVTNHIKCHYEDMKSYKSVMECCSVLEKLPFRFELSEILLHMTLECVHSLLESIQFRDHDQTKPIWMELLKVLLQTQSAYSRVRKFPGREDSSKMKTVERAFQSTNHDIMNEFALFFIHNEFNFNLPRSDVERFCDLVWVHMFPNAKETEHPDLLRNIGRLLIRIELKLEDSLRQEKYNINKNTEILHLFVETLNSERKKRGDGSNQDDDHLEPDLMLRPLSFVDDILNYELISDGISDCY